MNTYPLIRNRWSNEHLLAVLFITVSLYQLPDWVSSPVSILHYILIVTAALLLDSAINYLRYKKPVCAVSSAVTAAVLYPVIKDLPGWAGLIGIAAALIVGKHIWGGTGKNIFNPAVAAMFFLGMMFPLRLPLFQPSYLLIPALLLSLSFIIVRVFPGIGLMTGMLTALFLSNSLNLASIMAYGIIFWSCIVITDPATSTDNPIAGILLGALAGFTPLYFKPSLFALSTALLIFNGISFLIGQYSGRTNSISLSGVKIKSPITAMKTDIEVEALTEELPYVGCSWENMKAEYILDRIKQNDVFGMGGAGFPTVSKLEKVIESGAKKKYLIINGMECDPGLIHDKWLMSNRQAQISKGISVLNMLIGFNKTYFIAKNIENLSFSPRVEVKQLPDRYPYGAERIFVKKLLGISIPADSNSAQYGVLILNVQTVLAIYEAVCFDKKAAERFITVADLFSGIGHVVKVKIGERVSDIVERTVGSKGMIFVGGGIMQAHAALEDELVSKTTNLIAVGTLPKYKESHQCINCGLCKLYCPMGLDVKKIAELVDEGRLVEAYNNNARRCINCGTCSYICLAGKHLAARTAKN